MTAEPSTLGLVDDRAAMAFLDRIVGIYSPSGHEQAVAQAIVAEMGTLGFRAHVDAAGNAVGRLGKGARRIALLGHIDTVRGEIPLRREGDLLYGRGAVDAKGPLAAFVIAAARVGALPDTEILVIGAVEEEAATSKGAYYAVETYPRPDYVVIGEPSLWNRITLGYKGRLLIHYALERAMSHTAGAERRASEQAVDFWLRVSGFAQAYNVGKSGRFATLDPSLRAIRSTSDGLSERVDMEIGLRLPLGLDVIDLQTRLAQWAVGAEVSTRGHEVAYRAPKRNALTSAFLSAIRAEGSRATFVNKTGTSDMNVLGPRWGCPIVAYGPGDSSLDHTPDEHIDLQEYLRAIHVLERVLRRLALQRGA